MAKQEECTKCKKAKQNGYGEIKCSFYGRKPQFDDAPCPNYSKNETSCISECECQSASSKVKCPECGLEVLLTLSTCPNCGCPLKDNENGNTNKDDTSTNGLNGTLRCPDCGQEVSQTSSTCPNCGCPLKEQENENTATPRKDCDTDTGVLNEVSWCPQCGQKVPPMTNFCPKCGCSFKEYVKFTGNTKKSPSSRPHKKNGSTKILLIVVAGLVLLAGMVFAMKSFSSEKAEVKIRNNDPYMEKGWNFIYNRLKCPSTASLVGYISPDEELTSKLANESEKSGVKIAAYTVDAQNSFGAMTRITYYVCFRNGEPCVALPESDFSVPRLDFELAFLDYNRNN